jgi:D-3-phosphoglycerate dehydrogenase
MNITVLDDYQDAVRTLPAFRKVAGHNVTIWNDHTKDTDVLAERLRDTEALALVRERTPISAPLLERLNSLRIISQVSVYPHIDVDACTRRGIIISSDQMAARPSFATTELTWGLILCAMRRIPQEAAALKAGKWQAGSIGLCLRGRTLGVYGYGKTGSVVAGYGKAFGMQVMVWGRETTLAKARADGFVVAPNKEAFFEESDVLSIHVRLVEGTRGMVTAGDLGRMKTNALLVNTSRAGLIEPGALEAAMRAGRPGMAAVDVYEQEPVLDAQYPLLALDNVVCTPHLGYVERDGLEHFFNIIFDQILAYANGRPVNVVNPEALAARAR